MNTDDLYSLLRDPEIFHYESYLSQSSLGDVFLNTIELFSLGDIKHYVKYKDSYMKLDNLCIDKLLKLTLLTILGQNIGNDVNLSEVLTELVLLKDQEALEDLLMSMVISDLINVKIDQYGSKLRVDDVYVSRDAYNEENITLRVLTEEDVQIKSVKWARQILEAWLTQKIKPNENQLLQKPHESLDI